METLSRENIERGLESLNGWKATPNGLSQEWKFANFRRAMEFVNRVAELAETAKHHPDIDIRYNRVRLSLITHDAGGVTEKDVNLAREIDRL